MTISPAADTFTPDTDLSHGAYRLLRVLTAVRSYTDGRGRTVRRIGQGYLSARCGHVTKRQIRRYLGELEAGGRIARIPHRRRCDRGRWWSIECQSYVVHPPPRTRVSAGRTERTWVSGPPYRGSIGAGSAGRRTPAAPHPMPSIPRPGPDWDPKVTPYGVPIWQHRTTGEEIR